MPVRRFRLSTGHKIALWIVVLIVVWRSLSDPFVVEAILTFGLTGQIPGTSVVLSPDTVIQLSAALLVVMAAGIALRRKVKRGRTEKTVLAGQQGSHVAAQPVAHLVRPRMHQHELTPRSMPQIVHRTWIGRLSSQLAAKVREIRKILPYIRLGYAYCVWALRVAVRQTRVYALRALQWIVRMSKRCWTWASPYLWKFDAWLGAWFHHFAGKTHRKLRKNDKTSVMLDVARLGKHTVQQIAARYRRD